MSNATALCPRCGIRRTVNETRARDGLCADCRITDATWPAVTMPTVRPITRFPADEQAAIAAAVDAIYIAVRHTLQQQQRHKPRTTCSLCGCLIHPDETCPGCRAKTTRKAA